MFPPFERIITGRDNVGGFHSCFIQNSAEVTAVAANPVAADMIIARQKPKDEPKKPTGEMSSGPSLRPKPAELRALHPGDGKKDRAENDCVHKVHVDGEDLR